MQEYAITAFSLLKKTAHCDEATRQAEAIQGSGGIAPFAKYHPEEEHSEPQHRHRPPNK